MGTYRISQLAEHVGVPATTLRFYEREGLLPAARTPAGYRQYTDRDRERVRFIIAARQLGLPLDQIRDLLAVWAGGRCREVRDGLRSRVAAQVTAADERIAHLRLLRDRLTATLTHLRDLPARDGPCGPGCRPRPDVPGTVIACSLDGGAYRERAVEWGRLLADAEITASPEGGRTARLPAERAEQAVRLALAEQRCCPFLSFRLDVAGNRVELSVRAPDGAEAPFADWFHR